MGSNSYSHYGHGSFISRVLIPKSLESSPGNCIWLSVRDGKVRGFLWVRLGSGKHPFRALPVGLPYSPTYSVREAGKCSFSI